jgi:hypothetical protein
MKEAAVRCKKLLLELAAKSSAFKRRRRRDARSPPTCRAKNPARGPRYKDTIVYLKSDPSKAFPFGKFIADEGFGDHDLDITATYFGRPPETTWQGAAKSLTR